MMNYIFKTEKGETATTRACDKEQAKILAMARHGKDFMWATLIGINNKMQ